MDSVGEYAVLSSERGAQFGEARSSCSAEGGLGQPCVDADEIDRGGGEHVLQVGFCQAEVAGSAQAVTAHRLGDRAFDTGTDRVALLSLLGLLSLPGAGERLVLLAGTDGEFAGGGGRTGAA